MSKKEVLNVKMKVIDSGVVALALFIFLIVSCCGFFLFEATIPMWEHLNFFMRIFTVGVLAFMGFWFCGTIIFAILNIFDESMYVEKEFEVTKIKVK